MRTNLEEKITEEQLRHLGFAGTIQTVNDAGFVDFSKSKNPLFQDNYLDLENAGSLTTSKPRLVIRDLAETSQQFATAKTFRLALEKEYYYSIYKIKDNLVGNISFVDLSAQEYSSQDNNFFSPFSFKNLKKSLTNNFKFSRLRYPKEISNTSTLEIQTPSGMLSTIPAGPDVGSKNTKKYYYKWNVNLSDIPSGSLSAQGITTDFAQQSSGVSGILSGYYIPFPSTLDIQNYTPYNVETHIAPKFNDYNRYSLKGLLAISIGSADRKEIVYVSPHGMQTGFSNTIEKFKTVDSKIKNLTQGSRRKFVTLISGGYSGVNGIYKETVSYKSSGIVPGTRGTTIPRFRNKMPSGVRWTGNNPGINKKQIYWDNYNWNIELNKTGIYKSASQLYVNFSLTPYAYNTDISQINGIYTEVSGSESGQLRDKVWEKPITNKTNAYTKSLLYWDPTASLPVMGSYTIGDSRNTKMYVSLSNNKYADTFHTGLNVFLLNNTGLTGNANTLTGSQYCEFTRIYGRGQRRTTSDAQLFDGWYLPDQPAGSPTFLNSYILPYISGQTRLATGNFITQGSTVITGAAFWSGSGLTYITGTYYGSDGYLVSGQIVSGSGMSYYNQTRTGVAYSGVSGILVDNISAPYGAVWLNSRVITTFFSGTGTFSNIISTVSGSGYKPFISGKDYWYPMWSNNGSGITGDGIPFNKSGVQVINNIVYLSGIMYSGYRTGIVRSGYNYTYQSTVCDAGEFIKYAEPLYADLGGTGKNLLLYDNFGDYGYKGQWLVVNETSSKISGASGYNILFINNKATTNTQNHLSIPRVCWWTGVGVFRNLGVQINNSRTLITGAWTINRIPNYNSGFGNVNTRKFLNLLTSDNDFHYYNTNPEFWIQGQSSDYNSVFKNGKKLVFQPIPLSNTPNYPDPGNTINNDFPTKINNTTGSFWAGNMVSSGAASWYDQQQ